MTEDSLNKTGFYFEVEGIRKKSLNIFYFILIIGFFISLNGLQKFPILFFLNKIFAGLIIIVSILTTQKFFVPKLIKWYFIFAVVVFLTGAFVAINPEMHADVFFKIIQLIILLVAVAQFYIFVGDYRYFIYSFIMVGLIMCFAGRFLDSEMMYSGKIERYSSITRNSNGFAFQLLISSLAALYLWDRGKLLARVVIVVLLGIFLYYISISGSRKSLVSFGVLIFAWIFFSFDLKTKFKYLVAIALIGAIAGSYLYNLLADTAVMVRFSQLEEDTGGTDIRKTLYNEAYEVFQRNPVIGVGLNNFQEYSYSGLYAHSNFMEVLADTGIIGFTLFYALYVMVWIYSNKLNTLHDHNNSILAYTGLFKTTLILLLTASLGAVMYDSIPHWFILLIPIIIYEKERMAFESIEEEDELTDPVLKTE